MSTQEILTITIVLASLFAYINHRFIKWPPTIGIMALSLMCSIVIVIFGNKDHIFSRKAVQLASSIDFENLLMNFMLSFLLFAGAVHIDAGKLKKERLPVLLLASLGMIISTAVVGVFVWFMFGMFHLAVPLLFCLLFGALISPTDPIAVISILREAKIPSSLEVKIAGESLFNDGVAVVIFTTLAVAATSGIDHTSVSTVALLFVQQAVGGLLYGALLGYMGYWALHSVNDSKVEVMVTIAIVMGGYFLAGFLHVSGPLAMVVAGIIIGNKVRGQRATEPRGDYLLIFWELIDEILNAVLFLFMGLELLLIKLNFTILIAGSITVLIVLFARWLSVGIPVLLLRPFVKFEHRALTILTWGGLRGGISVALALSLSSDMYRNEFLPITYMVVVFSILVQGLTVGRVARMGAHGNNKKLKTKGAA